ncbi:MAG: cbb3-type cytochrome c oxidase N-terminal domain-containing protein [Sandaracinus sp.]
MSQQELKTDPIQGKIVHEYDGIEEADNQLPLWWLATFAGTVIFALVYWQVYETWGVAPSTSEIYAAEMAERLTSGGEVTDDVLVTLSADSSTTESGHQAFVTNCVVCHGDRGQGNIGPNLTDDHWIHGGAPTDIYATVRDGVGTRGMPQWGPVLGDRTLQAVVAYVLTIRDTNVEGPRGPEGELYVPGGAQPATDVAAPADGTAPADGAAPAEGAAPADGTAPAEGAAADGTAPAEGAAAAPTEAAPTEAAAPAEGAAAPTPPPSSAAP